MTRELAMRFELMEEVGRHIWEHGEGKPGQNTAVQNPEQPGGQQRHVTGGVGVEGSRVLKK